MTREEFISLRRSDMAEFMQNWQAERRNHRDGMVPADQFFMTGLVLRELAEAGMIETDGYGRYRPRNR